MMSPSSSSAAVVEEQAKSPSQKRMDEQAKSLACLKVTVVILVLGLIATLTSTIYYAVQQNRAEADESFDEQAASSADDKNNAYTPPLLYFNTTYAYDFVTKDDATHYFQYQKGWDAQITQAYCGVASAAALLNSLLPKEDLPIDPVYEPHAYATQLSMLNSHKECVNENVKPYNDTFNGIMNFPYGLTLKQDAQLLNCNLPSYMVATPTFADTVSLDTMRSDLQKALDDPQARVVVNYQRQAMGQEGGGHFSPIADYSAALDAFLILDVEKYGDYPPVWVAAANLHQGMLHKDTCSSYDIQMQPLLAPNLLQADTTEVEELAAKQLNCQARSRGYIIVQASE